MMYLTRSTDLASFIEYFAKKKRKKTRSEEDWFPPSLPFPSLVSIGSINSINSIYYLVEQ